MKRGSYSQKMNKFTEGSEQDSLELEAEIPELLSSPTTVESASEIMVMGSSPPDEENRTQDQGEAYESCQMSTMIKEETEAAGGGITSNYRPGDGLQLAGFDVLRFKNNFLEIVEELRLRRAQDSENVKRIQELVADKHEVMQNLDEAASKYESLTDNHTLQLQEVTKKNEEQLQQYKSDHVKSNLLCESREKELKALKDEMRALHLTKHNLEKKLQEQDRQLQLQNSSRENHLNKMAQLEEKCSSLFSLADDVKEQIERLEVNVKHAGELHHKLEYMNKHQKCEISQLQERLDTCHQELVQHRAQVLATTNSKANTGTNLTTKLRTAEQELKLQVELCKHLQDELVSLREEHQVVLRQMKEAHTLLEKHVESNSKSLEKEVNSYSEEELQKEVGGLKSEVEKLNSSLSTVQEEWKMAIEKHQQEINACEEVFDDTKHRLKSLQDDFKALQDSYESLEASKSNMKTEHDLQMQQLNEKCKTFESDWNILKTVNKELESKVCLILKQVKSFQSALDQSEAELATCEMKVKLKEQLLFELKRGQLGKTQCPVTSQQVELAIHNESTQPAEISSQLSPEVITNLPHGPVLIKDTPASHQDKCIYNDRVSPDYDEVPPEPKRAKLQSSYLSSPIEVVLVTEALPCQQHSDASTPSQFCHAPPGSRGDAASSVSPMEIKESPMATLSETVDQCNNVIRDEEEERENNVEEEVVEVKNKVQEEEEVVKVKKMVQEEEGVVEVKKLVQEEEEVVEVKKKVQEEEDKVGEEEVVGMKKVWEEEKREKLGKVEELVEMKKKVQEEEVVEVKMNEEKETLQESSEDSSVSSPSGGLREKSASLMFSPEEHLDEENNFMISTQISRQIERVKRFLKTDRLRRPKKS